eukprot:GILI01018251.1.p1 GENE.GILI01018251.1~~GILI01018251.1.p1  ORF type:complete len:226 (-),score=36.26 GILI01018251.1:171-848(-)
MEDLATLDNLLFYSLLADLSPVKATGNRKTRHTSQSCLLNDHRLISRMPTDLIFNLPAMHTLPKGTVLYRGGKKRGNWFAKDLATAEAYAAATFPHDVWQFVVRDNVDLVEMAAPQTRSYFSQHQTGNTNYEKFVESARLSDSDDHSSCVGFDDDMASVDSDGVAPHIHKLVRDHGFKGWAVHDGCYRFRPSQPKFHREIMLVLPRDDLFEGSWCARVQPSSHRL